MLLDLLYRLDAPERPSIARADAERLIADVRSLGFCCVHRAGQSSERSNLSVPVLAGGDTLAALSVRFAGSAVTQQVIMERFLPALRRAAHAMVECCNRSPGAPLAPPQRKRGQGVLATTER
jgi:hypothetical protein